MIALSVTPTAFNLPKNSTIKCPQVAQWLKKKPACQCRRQKRHGFNPCVGKIPWRRAWQPAPVFLPGEPHGEKSLAGYSPCGRKELDTLKQFSMHACSLIHNSLNQTLHCQYTLWQFYSSSFNIQFFSQSNVL